ncbi:MAG: TetR/AcrR family transcriptional regulator [Thermoflexales bacterium]|nr:TetR/AcrR family transcriptional regulator [Thermoflexales bacterium]
MPPEDKDRRQQILDAAQQVFAKKGFHGASIKDLAKAAGISPGLLYWYFKDKTDLFTSLLSERITEGFGSLAEEVPFDLPPKEFLPRFGRFYVGLFERPMNAALFKVSIANAQSFPAAVRQVQAQLIGRVLGTLQAYFQHQIDAGRMRPCNTEMATRVFMGSIVAYLLLRHVLGTEQGRALPLETFVDGVVDVVLHGILPVATSRSEEL